MVVYWGVGDDGGGFCYVGFGFVGGVDGVDFYYVGVGDGFLCWGYVFYVDG